MNPQRHENYDPDQPDSIRPDLHAIPGGGETSKPKRGHLSAVPNTETASSDDLQDRESNNRHLKAVPDQPAAPVGGTGLRSQEQQAQLGANWATNLGKAAGVTQKVRMSFNRRAAIIGFGGIGGIAGIAIAFFSFIGPLKVLHTVTNLQETFFAASNHAGDEMGSQLFNHYIISKVIPGMATDSRCNSTRTDRSCAAVGDSGNPISALYAAWRDNNLEGKMADRFGIEISKGSDGHYFLRTNGLNEPLDLGQYNGNTRTLNGQPYAQLSRSEVRTEIRRSLQNETFSNRIRYKYSIGKLMERKYNIRRCIVACDQRDRAKDTIDLRKNIFKSTLVERVITPRSEMMGLALNCALSSFDCTDPGDADETGERKSKFQEDMQRQLRDYRSKFGESSLEDLEKEVARVRENGVTGYIVRRMAGDLAGDVTAKIVGKGVPIVGWIDGINRGFQASVNAGPAIKHINYVMGSASAVALAGLLYTNADEQKTGLVDAAEQGSISSSLDSNTANDQGGGGMMASPLYQQMFGEPVATTASLTNILNPTAYAATSGTETSNFVCNDGNEIPAGSTVCPEVGFGAFSTAAQIALNVSEFANSAALGPLRALSDIWSGTIGAVFDWFGDVLGSLVGSVTDAIVPDSVKESMIAWIQDNITNKFFVDPIGGTGNPSGARIFELAALGSEVMGNDSAQYVQGGAVLTDEQANAVMAAMLQEDQTAFDAKPLYARLFDGQDSHSLISRVALMVPSNTSSAARSMGSVLLQPFNLLSHGFSALFTIPKAKAAYTPTTSPFGLPRMGYALNDPVFSITDPEAYWAEHDCGRANLKQEWGNKATEIDPNTGVPLQRTTEPCMLIRSAVADNGGMYDTSLLLPDETQTASSGSGSNSGDNTIESGDTVSLAQQILDNPNISFQTADRRAEFQLIATNNGRATQCGAPVVSPKLLGVVLQLAKEYKLVLGVVVDSHGCDGGQHPKGKAIDINGVNYLNGNEGTGNNIRFDANELPILRDFYKRAGEVLAANGGGGLGQADKFPGGAPKVDGVQYFSDTANHLHMDVRD